MRRKRARGARAHPGPTATLCRRPQAHREEGDRAAADLLRQARVALLDHEEAAQHLRSRRGGGERAAVSGSRWRRERASAGAVPPAPAVGGLGGIQHSPGSCSSRAAHTSPGLMPPQLLNQPHSTPTDDGGIMMQGDRREKRTEAPAAPPPALAQAAQAFGQPAHCRTGRTAGWAGAGRGWVGWQSCAQRGWPLTCAQDTGPPQSACRPGQRA